MVTSDLFAELSIMPPLVVRVFVVLMIIASIVGALANWQHEAASQEN
jgi:hypothetical protein